MLERAPRLESQFEALVRAPQNFSGPLESERCTTIAHFLTDEEIQVFVDAGTAAIPILMRYVRDPRMTICCYVHPTDSWCHMDYMTADRLAMFLLEATLRKQAHFARSTRIFAPAQAPNRTQPRLELSLAQAADAYEEWFEACYNLQTGQIRSSTCVPQVSWCYSKAAAQSDREGSLVEEGK